MELFQSFDCFKPLSGLVVNQWVGWFQPADVLVFNQHSLCLEPACPLVYNQPRHSLYYRTRWNDPSLGLDDTSGFKPSHTGPDTLVANQPCYCTLPLQILVYFYSLAIIYPLGPLVAHQHSLCLQPACPLVIFHLQHGYTPLHWLV